MTTAAGTTISADAFTIDSAQSMTLTGLSNSLATVGQPFTVLGTNFGGAVSDYSVAFGLVKTTPTTKTSSSLTVTVPIGAMSGPVRVQNNLASAAGEFDVYVSPSGQSISALASTGRVPPDGS
ncbi:MAG: hypothetical protein HC933_15165, partial [Pleurocapsa sp. SU_196_0]|nr:hypothetical protein [Pleurocapsa sp. SU_196_0]